MTFATNLHAYGLLEAISKSIYDEAQEVRTAQELEGLARLGISYLHQQTFALDPYVTTMVLPLENNRTTQPTTGLIVAVEGVCDSHGNVEMYLLDSIERPADGLHTYELDGDSITVVPPYTFHCDAHIRASVIKFNTLGVAGGEWVSAYIKKEIYASDGTTSGDSNNLATMYANEFARRLSTARKREA